MSKQCPCSRHCRHLVPSARERLLPPAKLLELEPVLGTLLDAADAFDSDILVMESECEVHGLKPVSNGSCSCRGDRSSAVEFVMALGLDIRVAQPAEQTPDARERMSASARRRWARAREPEAIAS